MGLLAIGWSILAGSMGGHAATDFHHHAGDHDHAGDHVVPDPMHTDPFSHQDPFLPASGGENYLINPFDTDGGIKHVPSVFSEVFGNEAGVSLDSDDCSSCGIGPTGPNGGPTSDPDRVDMSSGDFPPDKGGHTTEGKHREWMRRKWLEDLAAAP